jgi:hypothetical protein
MPTNKGDTKMKKHIDQLKLIKAKLEIVKESLIYECNTTMGLENDIERLNEIIKELQK